MDKVVTLECPYMGSALKGKNVEFTLEVADSLVNPNWTVVDTYVSQLGDEVNVFKTESLTSQILKKSLGSADSKLNLLVSESITAFRVTAKDSELKQDVTGSFTGSF